MSSRKKNFGQYQGVEAYPLHWPAGVSRTTQRMNAKFGTSTRTEHGWRQRRDITVAEARSRLLGEMSAMTRSGRTWRVNPDEVVISSNMPTRLDGLPRSGSVEPKDPGVAVYFHLDGVPHCLPCDRWTAVADNLAAIAAHVGAMRGMERWGVGDIKAAFAGFRALPPPNTITPAMTLEEAARWMAQVCGETITVKDLLESVDITKAAYRTAARRTHPDTGGSQEQFVILQEAKRVLDAHHAGGGK